MLLRMAFGDKIIYDRHSGFRTAVFSQPFMLLADLREGNYEMVELSGEVSNRLFEVLENWVQNLKY